MTGHEQPEEVVVVTVPGAEADGEVGGRHVPAAGWTGVVQGDATLTAVGDWTPGDRFHGTDDDFEPADDPVTAFRRVAEILDDHDHERRSARARRGSTANRDRQAVAEQLPEVAVRLREVAAIARRAGAPTVGAVLAQLSERLDDLGECMSEPYTHAALAGHVARLTPGGE